MARLLGFMKASVFSWDGGLHSLKCHLVFQKMSEDQLTGSWTHRSGVLYKLYA